MKKTLLALALAAASISSFAAGPFGDVKGQSLIAQFDYNNVAGRVDSQTRYGYFGIAQKTSYGIFDIGIQGLSTKVAGFDNDNAHGFEFGYSYPLVASNVRLIPRIAYSGFNEVDRAGSGFSSSPRFLLASIEANRQLTPMLGGYVAYTRQQHLDSEARDANRFQAGVDIAVTPNFDIRTGVSTQKIGAHRQNGIVLVGKYAF